MKNKHIQIRISEDLHNKLKKKRINISEEVRQYLMLLCNDSSKICKDNGHKRTIKEKMRITNKKLIDMENKLRTVDLHAFIDLINDLVTLSKEKAQEDIAEKILKGGSK